MLALESSEGRARFKTGKPRFILPALFAVIVCGALAFLFISYHTRAAALEAEERALESYVSNPANISAYEDAVKAKADANLMRDRTYMLKNVLLGIASHPDPDGAQYADIFALGGDAVRIGELSYDRATGVLSLHVEAAAAEQIFDFVSKLRNGGVFDDILHEGYRRGGAEDGAIFSSDLSCVVKRPEPALPETPKPLPIEANPTGESSEDGGSHEE
ncbi:MAG: hypothetical protein LBL63_00830 [Clostridiales Family XIII bacterium]|nr:hypothetical protein [Clostridiales Family XIII bacterium]